MRRITAAALLAGLVFMILFPVGWEYLGDGPRRLALWLVVLWGILWLLSLARRKIVAFSLPKISLPLVALLGLQLFQTARAELPLYEMYRALDILVLLAALLFVIDSKSLGWKNHTWEDILIFSALFISLWDVIYLATWIGRWWELAGTILALPPITARSPGILIWHPNYLAGYLNLAFPLVAVRAIQGSRWSGRLFWGAISLYLLGMIFLSGSRAGWLGWAGSLLVLVSLMYGERLLSLLRQPQQTIRQSLATPRLRAAWMVVGFGFIAAIGLAVYQLQTSSHGTAANRMAIWKYAWDLFQASPFTGQGSGLVAFLFALRPEALGVDEVFHAHNLWLQVAAGMGVVGIGLSLWALALGARALRSAWLNFQAQSDRAAIAALAAGLTSILIHNLLDFFFWKMTLILGTVILLGLIYHRASPGTTWRVGRMPAILILAGLFAAILAGAAFAWRGLPAHTRGAQALGREDFIAARTDLCLAADQNPLHTQYLFHCALANALVAFQENDPDALRTALALQKEALDIDPYWYLHWANLASYEWQAGQEQAAIQHMRRAADMAPTYSYLWLNLGWMEEQHGQLDAASEHYRRVACHDPGYADSLFFTRSSFRSTLLQQACPAEFDNLQAKEARRLFTAGELARWDGNFQSAEDNYRQAIQSWPNSMRAYAGLALLYQAAGKPDQARLVLANGQTAAGVGSSDLKILVEALQTQGESSRAEQYLDRFVEQARHPAFSRHYYIQAYDGGELPIDVSPYLLLPALSEESLAVYERYAAALEREQNTDQAARLRLWLAQQANLGSIPR